MVRFNRFKNLNYLSECAKARGTLSPKLAVTVIFVFRSAYNECSGRADQIQGYLVRIGDKMSRLSRCLANAGLTVVVACALIAVASQDQTQQQPPPPSPASEGGVTQPQATPPADQAYRTENPEQLQQLVAPIALYPDSLVASILAASSFPSQITQANDWLAPRRNLPPEEIAAEADKQNWDPSVKSLLVFSPILQNLATNLAWTSELGDAYYNQPTDVMNAIQEMRRQAKKHGTLKSNDQIKVEDKHGYITIEPRDPDSRVVYVPAFNPWVVYGYPVAPWPGWVTVPGVWWDGPGLYFGTGFGLGPFWGYGWGWPAWGLNWWGGGIYFGGGPWRPWGSTFFDRGYYYHGYPGFAQRSPSPEAFGRGFGARAPGTLSGPFSGLGYGGETRGFSARGQGSFGGFHGGGFGGGGFGGGGFHGGGGRR